MNTSQPEILLLRQPAEPDPYVDAFTAEGIEAWCLPVLRFEFVGEVALRERLARPEAYGGLVCTSQRAVEALREVDLTAWRDKPTFVVGPATAEAARALRLRPRGEDAGDADTLAGYIAGRSFARPLLFLCGNQRRDELPDRLRAAAVAFEEFVAYRTVLMPSVLDGLAADPPDWVAFFSPSGVEAALLAPGFPWNSLSCAAIGPTTAAALDAAGYPPDAVAAEPSPEALVSAVARHLAHA